MVGPWRCSSRRWGGVALACLALALAEPSVPAQAAPADARIVSEQRIDARLRELTVAAPALGTRTKVRVLLPDGYRAGDDRRYPVLYLLHGAGGDETDWTDDGAAARATAGKPLIVVMPDGGKAGWYTDWSNDGAGGPPAWERYHVRELVPLVDQRFRTIPARRGRAIAGLSMGGFGAFSYAARHPDLFTAAASTRAASISTPSSSVSRSAGSRSTARSPWPASTASPAQPCSGTSRPRTSSGAPTILLTWRRTCAD